MFLDLVASTYVWVALVAVANILLWARAITIEGVEIDRFYVATYTIIMLAFLAVAGSFLLVMKPSELTKSLTAWAFLAGTIMCAGATGLLYAKYSR